MAFANIDDRTHRNPTHSSQPKGILTSHLEKSRIHAYFGNGAFAQWFDRQPCRIHAYFGNNYRVGRTARKLNSGSLRHPAAGLAVNPFFHHPLKR